VELIGTANRERGGIVCSRGFKRLFKINLGQTGFKDAWELQKKLVALRYTSQIPDCLLLTEHRPVITMGRATSPGNILCSPEELARRGVELFSIERGGDVTFHGPGQLVAYPIIDLNARGRDLHRYLRDLESLIIATLNDLGLQAETKRGLTGVWARDHKLAAIGVAVSRWITYHGLALNINTDMEYFKLINPCGITQYPVSSVSRMLSRTVELSEAAEALADNFARIFYYEMETVEDINSLIHAGATV
jgi:lipoate-protein ligase B